MARDTLPEEEFTDDVGVGNFHEKIEFGLSDDGNDGDDESDWTDESGSSDQGVDGNDEDANDNPYGGKDDGKNSNNRRNGHTGNDDCKSFLSCSIVTRRYKHSIFYFMQHLIRFLAYSIQASRHPSLSRHGDCHGCSVILFPEIVHSSVLLKA